MQTRWRQAVAVVVAVSSMRHERRHVELLWKGDERRDLFVLNTRVLEALEMKARYDGKLFHRELLGALLVSLAVVAFDFGGGAEMFGPRKSFEAVEERSRRARAVVSHTGGRAAHRCWTEIEGDIPEGIDRRRHTAVKRTFSNQSKRTRRNYKVARAEVTYLQA